MNKTLVVLGSAILLAACSATPRGGWEWHHPNTEYAEKNRIQDVFECDEYAEINKMGDRLDHMFADGYYGGWGEFTFDYCMRERGWYQEYHPAPTPPETALNAMTQELQ